MTRILLLLLPAVVFLLEIGVSDSSAQTPDVISYQGYIEANGEPLNDSGATLTFRIYKAPEDGLVLWTETHEPVVVVHGVFSVMLGRQNPLGAELFEGAAWLGMTLGDPAAPELSPRTEFTNVPYSYQARFSQTASAVAGLRIMEPGSDSAAPNVLLGHATNRVEEGVEGATISGGGHDNGGSMIWPNVVQGNYGTIGGGRDNIAVQSAATIAGGEHNRAGSSSTVCGGYGNRAEGILATIVGGESNAGTGRASVIGGGYNNTAGGYYSSVPGGHRNNALGDFSFAAGFNAKALHKGSFVWHDAGSVAAEDSAYSTAPNQFVVSASGGVIIDATSYHGIQVKASGQHGVYVEDASSDGIRVDQAGGWAAYLDGDVKVTNGGLSASKEASLHVTGNSSAAHPHLYLQETGAGDFARLRMQNSDEFADYWDIAAGGTNTGRLNFFTRDHNVVTFWPHHIDYVNLISTSNGAVLTQGGVWQNASSRESKTAFELVNVSEVLEKVVGLPISQWRYKVEPESVRHVGPVAEDFYDAFGLGTDEKSIGTVDVDGVALAAIQGLHRLVQEQKAEIEALQNEVREMKARLATQ